MKHSELRKALKLAKEYGVSRLKLADLEVDFHPPAVTLNETPRIPAQPSAADPLPATSAKLNGRLPTDDEFLMLSSPYGPKMNEAGLVVEDEPADANPEG